MLTVTISDQLEARLQSLVTRYNVAQGASLSLSQWLELHLLEMCIQEDLAQAVQSLQEAKERSFASDVQAARDRMVRDLRTGGATLDIASSPTKPGGPA